MGQAVLQVTGLPETALDAAAGFHADWLPRARAALVGADSLALVFAPAPLDHRGWRLAVVQDLARAAAPVRVNGVAGSEPAALAATLEWLAMAPGVTGQLLAVDGQDAVIRAG